MRKDSTKTWVLVGFLSFIGLLVVAFSLYSWSTSASEASHDSTGAKGVLVTEPDSVTMLDRHTGGQIWQYQTKVTDFTPLIVNNMVYIVSQDSGDSSPDNTDMLEALNLESGKLIWSWSWKEHWTEENPPLVVNGVIYLSESNLSASALYSPAPLSEYQGFVVALRASDGQQLWKTSLHGLLSPATVVNGTIYVSNGEAVLALQSNDGHQLWQYQPKPNEDLSYYAQSGMQVRETNVIVALGNQVYIYLRHVEGNQSANDLVALDSHNGQMIWRYQSHAEMQPLLLQNGVIYVTHGVGSGDSFVVALNASSGSVLWTYHTEFPSQPLIVNNVLYIDELTADSKHTSNVVALRITDGSILRRYLPSKGIIFGMPVVSQNVLYLSVGLPATKTQPTPPTTLFALDLKTGTETWHAEQIQPYGHITVIVSQGQIYAFSPWDYMPDTLVVLQAKNGSQLWNYPAQSWIYHVMTDFN